MLSEVREEDFEVGVNEVNFEEVEEIIEETEDEVIEGGLEETEVISVVTEGEDHEETVEEVIEIFEVENLDNYYLCFHFPHFDKSSPSIISMYFKGTLNVSVKILTASFNFLPYITNPSVLFSISSLTPI